MTSMLNKCELCGKWYQIYVEGALFVCYDCLLNKPDEVPEIINDDYQPSYVNEVGESNE